VRIAVFCNESRGARDAIRDHSVLLAGALGRREGVVADLHQRTASGRWIGDCSSPPRRRLDHGLDAYDWIFLQYNPFMYGRWGVAPWLVSSLSRLRRRQAHPRVALMAHEMFVEPKNVRWALMGAYQRAQLAALRAPADVVCVSIDAWTRRLAAWWPSRPSFHMPVGSNLPDMTGAREDQRRRLGVGDDALVLAAFGTEHPSRLVGHIVAGANAVAAAVPRALMLNLGEGTRPLTGLDPRVEVHQPGALPAEAVARHLAAADIFLAPFSDGVSTRRTTVMAALQHGLPIVGTSGGLTDPMLTRSTSAMRLVPVGDVTAFGAAVRLISENSHLRCSMAEAARVLHTREFDWPVAAERLLRVLNDPLRTLESPD
jgi:glycosyltransferase involved in cell wall biosynthesis